MNNRAASRDTEQGVVLAPSTYWQSFLKPKLEALLSARCPRASIIDKNVKISVNDRGERDVTKRFDQTKIQWVLIEK